MTNTYFKTANTLEELRKQYKELLKIHHPDNGGNVETMQEINSAYDTLFKRLKNSHESSANNKEEKTSYHNMKYDFAEDEKLREILNKVIHFSDIVIEIIGNWIWISGNTYPYRKELKEIGFKFAGQKKMWYWHSEAFQKKSNRKLTINDIRDYYGSTEVETETRRRIETA